MEPLDLTVRKSIQKMDGMELSQEIIALADVDGFVQKMNKLFTGLDQVNGRMNEITNAPWYTKFFYNLTGKTAKTHEEAMQMYGEVLQVVLQLSALNAIFGKKLSDQQKIIENLSREILEQSQRQDQQDKKHEKNLVEIKERQEEVLRLVENQNKVLKILPELKDGLDGLIQKFQKHDERLEGQARDIDSLKGDVKENQNGLSDEGEARAKLEKKLNGAIIALSVLAVVTMAGFVFLIVHSH